jgi:hypothetical protein
MLCPIKIDTGNNKKGVLIYERDDDNNRSSKNARNKTNNIKKWEEMGKVKKAKRDQRGWRVYDQNDAKKLMALHIVHQI